MTRGIRSFPPPPAAHPAARSRGISTSFTEVSGSRTTLAGWLARMGFAGAARAERLLLTDLGITAAELKTNAVVIALAAVADPDLALAGLARIFAATGSPDALRT